jgi:uncharacterized protein (DUF2236 family)
MIPSASAHVDAAALERELAWVRAGVANPIAGVFGPGSLIWRINREAATFFGAGRALLLQLAHPWVAAAIAEHSTTIDDPILRFQRTFSIVFAMVFGSRDQALAAARRLHARHEHVRGVLPERAGRYPARSAYQANSVPALTWVHATLIETAAMMHDLVLPPLSDSERDSYLVESDRFAALFGIPRGAVAGSWRAFADYNTSMWNSDILAVSPAARSIGTHLLSARQRLLQIPQWYRDLTAGLLPPQIREGYEMRYDRAARQRAERAVGWIQTSYGRLPSRLRYVAPYQEAVSRLHGQREPDWMTQALNHFWIGCPTLTAADKDAADRHHARHQP